MFSIDKLSELMLSKEGKMLIGIIVTLVSVELFIFGPLRRTQEANLKSKGIVVPGIVTEAFFSKGSNFWRVSYTYRSKNYNGLYSCDGRFKCNVEEKPIGVLVLLEGADPDDNFVVIERWEQFVEFGVDRFEYDSILSDFDKCYVPE